MDYIKVSTITIKTYVFKLVRLDTPIIIDTELSAKMYKIFIYRIENVA